MHDRKNNNYGEEIIEYIIVTTEDPNMSQGQPECGCQQTKGQAEQTTPQQNSTPNNTQKPNMQTTDNTPQQTNQQQNAAPTQANIAQSKQTNPDNQQQINYNERNAPLYTQTNQAISSNNIPDAAKADPVEVNEVGSMKDIVDSYDSQISKKDAASNDQPVGSGKTK